MRRSMIGIVALGVILTAGISFAQTDGPPAMPEKVRKFLDSMGGTWNVAGVWEGDGKAEGQMENVWNSRTNTLVGNAEYQWKDISGAESSLWHWDGISQDGVILSWSGLDNKGFSRGTVQGRVLSPTLMEGTQTNFVAGVKVTANVRVEVDGPNRYTWQRTNRIANGERKPDETDVYARVRPTTREDFQEYCRLYQGQWTCDITWDVDWPGIGKKGETVTAYLHNTISEDGNALIRKFRAGGGSYSEFVVYDTGTRRIRALWATSGGGMGHSTAYRSGDQWLVTCKEIEADGTRSEYTNTEVFGGNGDTLTITGTGTVGDEAVDTADVWRRMSK